MFNFTGIFLSQRTAAFAETTADMAAENPDKMVVVQSAAI